MFDHVIFILGHYPEQEQEQEAKTIWVTLPRGVASNGEGNLGGWGLHDERSKPATGEESPFPKPWYPNKP